MQHSWQITVFAVFCLASQLTAISEQCIYGHEDTCNNLLNNPGFEDDITTNDWGTFKCAVLRRSMYSHSGQYGMKVTAREKVPSGLYQRIYNTGKLKANTLYYMSAFVKLVSSGADIKDPTSISMMFKNVYSTTDKRPHQKVRGRAPFLYADNRWRQIGGDFRTPENISDLVYVEIKMHVNPISATYLLDTAALTEIPIMENWSEQLDNEILNVRTSQVNLKTTFPQGYPMENTTIRIRHNKHEFKFGTAVKAGRVADNAGADMRYKAFIAKNFNWAVFESDMKWQAMETSPGVFELRQLKESLQWLRDNNLKIRGHNLLWEIPDRNPSWVQTMTGSTLKEAITKRVTYMMTNYSHVIDEWDLCNEYLNKHFYEDKSGDPNLLFEEFKIAHSIDPNATLCLNDYLIARDGSMASAQMELAKTLQAQNIRVGCVGVMSHLKTLPIDVDALRKRMRIVSQAHVPVVITELSIHTPDVKVRAQALERALKVYFSEPNINGVMFWGFSDVAAYAFANDTSLTSGTNFEPNEAGQMYIDLKDKWSTKHSYTVNNLDSTSSFSAFHGCHSMIVNVNGKDVYTHDFDVLKDMGKNVDLDISVPPITA